MAKKVQNKSRKQQRKESRLAKKARKHEFFSKKKTSHQAKSKPDDQSYDLPKTAKSKSQLSKLPGEKPEKKGLSLQDEKLKELQQLNKQTKSLEEQMRKKRVKQLKEDAAADDLEIQRLEKHLGLKKKKEKSKANFFASDGLDYLLDVCDRTKLKDTVEAEKRFKEDDTDFGDDLEKVTGKKVMKRSGTNVVCEEDAPHSKKKKVKVKSSSIENEKIIESSDSEPEEFLSTKVGSMFQKKTKSNDEDVDSESLEEGDNDIGSLNSDVNDESDHENSGMASDDSDDGYGFDDEDSEGSDDDLRVNSQLAKRSEDNDITAGSSKGSKGNSTLFKKNMKKSEEIKRKDDVKSTKKQKKQELNKKSEAKDQRGETRKSKRDKNIQKLDNLQDDSDDGLFSDGDVSDGDGGEGATGSEQDHSGKEEDEPKAKEDQGFWEDIYGRTRDKEGNVVTKYQPPQLRKQLVEGGHNQEKLLRLKKQMKGLLNRLAENNMVSISSQIEALYGTHSRNEMNETLWGLYREALLGETDSPERLVAEHAMLLAILGANIGGEVSAHCLQRCVMHWHQLWSAGANVQDKTSNNVLLLLSYMYHFKLFHCTLLYDILEQLLEKLEEKEIELILLVLRTVGFPLRKEDPARLKDFVLKAQTLANNTTSASSGTRVKFLLDTVLAIKNNNMSKIPNYNPEYADHLKKALKACVRKGNYNAELKISLEDLLKADERGRWWVVGSAWTGDLPGEKGGVDENRKPVKKLEEGFSNKLMELARKQRMNTDTRRTVFCILMSAEDYLDAFEKLLKLGLKGPPEREIMNVLLHCLLQEKEFNPYYEHLARRFCNAHRRFQVMLQFASWDRIQNLKALSPSQVTNLAKFLGHLILEKNLAISVLKVVEFGELDKPAVRFIRQVLLAILLTDSEEAMVDAFGRIAASKALKLFREGLRLFLHHFVLRNSKDMAGTDMALLTTRVKLADSALSAADRSLAF